MKQNKMKKGRIILTFSAGGSYSGPHTSHLRIMDSELSCKYEYIRLDIPRFRKIIMPRVFLRTLKQIRSARADIMHVSGLGLEGFYSTFLAKMAGLRVVCAIRGSEKDSLDVPPILKLLISIAEKWTLKEADVCYANSQYVANWDIVQKYAKKMWGVIYNFPPEYGNKSILLAEDQQELKREWGISEKDIVVVSMGRVTADKGYDTMTEVITKRKWERTTFIILGAGNYLETMKKRIRNDINNNHVVFANTTNEVFNFLSIADIFMLCTKHETFGNAIAEAQWVGVPVIASKTGGIPEIVMDGTTGLLIDSRDVEGFVGALEELISNHEKRGLMSSHATSHIRDVLEAKKIESCLDNLYQSVID